MNNDAIPLALCAFAMIAIIVCLGADLEFIRLCARFPSGSGELINWMLGLTECTR